MPTPALPLRLTAGLRTLAPIRSTPALLRAVRATIVVAGLFALTDQVFENLQMATFAALGAFATLVLATFNGTRRDKLVAHALLALAGSALLSIGTAVSSSTALAAIVTVPVTFSVFFAGVIGPNAASGAIGAMLTYVLPTASAGTVSMIPDRLAGWWLASAFGTAAVLALSPRRGSDPLRSSVTTLARVIAEEIRATLGEGRAGATGIDRITDAKHELMAKFNATPFRPLGLAAPDQALANVVELLEWCASLVTDAVREHDDLQHASAADLELLAASADVLLGAAGTIAAERTPMDLDRLERCREASLAAMRAGDAGGGQIRRTAETAFHAQAIAVAVLALAAEALVAERLLAPSELDELRSRYAGSLLAPQPEQGARLARATASVTRHASVRSVWFINSARAAIALGAAVLVADLSSVQHGFWVVLGTLSVLRTNASSTGATALRAFGGTVLGFVVGGALLVAIGSDTTALWLVLPAAVFVAAYAPGTAPFTLGQAAFTVTVAVLFNLIAPAGWRIGIVRIEDVAIGCAVSLLVGTMFWPRGVAAVVGDDLADAYRTGASFLLEAIGWTTGVADGEPAGAPAATAAAVRLEDALRGFLAEQGSKRIGRQEL
ncbi:MAG TPA: FUSC family protein, partial [Solirubrobacteraceae bacterium]|nr:FUSC family protein [Solirubrobacteraceae bacterium]